ncbi:hypothetical protein G5S37_15080 [Roseimicrobium sp. ORNL1]|nr:hypothetical protein G5S37_15080 [Roseimicrobium sp. ORNL1]
MAGELLAQLLKDQGRGPGQVICAETRSRSMGHRERGENIPLIVLPKARGEVVRQFRDVALRKCRLEEVFGDLDGLDLDIQEWEAIQDCFTDCRIESGWKTFRARFPRTRGLLEVSCPAFSSDFSQAMIEYTNTGAYGECCLYQRENDEWRLVEKKCIWFA